MAMLVCDVCGGNLQMDVGGKTATCQFCGMQYSVERMREKIQEIRGTVKVEGSVQARQTGTTEDVEQWRVLMHKYLEASDYQSAYDMIGKSCKLSRPMRNAANCIRWSEIILI